MNKPEVKKKDIQIPPHYHPMAFRPEDVMKLESFIVTLINTINTTHMLTPLLNSKLITERVKAQERMDQMTVLMDIARRTIQGEVITKEELDKHDFIIQIKPSEIEKK